MDPQHWFLLIYSPVFQDHWNALVQVRQKTQQRKTLFYVEQLLIKYNATKVKGDELNMPVSFWYLGKSELSSLHVYTVHCTVVYSGRVTFSKVSEKHGHVQLMEPF